MADELQLVIFQVGRKTLALPLQEVEHILSLGGEEGRQGISAEGGMILFQGQAIPWRPLWEPLGEPSVFREFDELAQTLPRRRQDHLDWMAALEQSLRHDIPFTKAHSPRECAFGQWFYAFRTEDRRLALLLSQFEHPHALVHGLAEVLLGQVAAGRREEALAALDAARQGVLAELLALFDTVIALVPTLKRPLALILNDSGQRTALGVDRVLDIRSVTAAEVHPARGRLGSLVPQAFIGDSASGGALIPLLAASQLASLG